MLTGTVLERVPGSNPAEYRYTERYRDVGAETVAEYLSSYDIWEICPEDEVPVIHRRDDATVIRCWLSQEYLYELLWPES